MDGVVVLAQTYDDDEYDLRGAPVCINPEFSLSQNSVQKRKKGEKKGYGVFTLTTPTSKYFSKYPASGAPRSSFKISFFTAKIASELSIQGPFPE
jgi:hypothetical protein